MNHDTLTMLLRVKSGEAITTTLGGGLNLAFARSSDVDGAGDGQNHCTFTVSRKGVRPSPNEIQVVCRFARRAGLMLSPTQAQPDQQGDYHIVRWTVVTIKL
jgi:hypothetical protein